MQWNAGGWFGAQIGSTIWIAILAALVTGASLKIAAVALACFIAPNAIGAYLWFNRARFNPLRALEGLILAAGVCGFACVQAIDSAGLWGRVSGVALNESGAGTVSATWMKIAIVSVTIALLALYRFGIGRGSK